jgi:hypothetical protein
LIRRPFVVVVGRILFTDHWQPSNAKRLQSSGGGGADNGDRRTMGREREQKMFFLFFVHCHALGLILLQLFFFITMSRMEELQYKLSEQAMLHN